ncbi:MAG: flagellar assembly protein FliW [Sulfuricurvum sp.]|nr:flagellar assembly protein FliW [Sulfuricurvum sp.]MDP3022679.1 flagellar assembly protein FliW [Sulfuricurvum sp.]MDP3120919.1 flagellar assembly protein FliW [Sulfuricurvum sp.]
MQYNVKSSILGFDQVSKVELSEIDELFSTLKSCDDDNTSFTVVNPYMLREYSFDVPKDIRDLLDINEDSKVVVYNVMIVQDPLDESRINFMAPLIFNQGNGSMAQAVLDSEAHSEFGVAVSLKTFRP